jgi:hypothetical protein
MEEKLLMATCCHISPFHGIQTILHGFGCIRVGLTIGPVWWCGDTNKGCAWLMITSSHISCTSTSKYLTKTPGFLHIGLSSFTNSWSLVGRLARVQSTGGRRDIPRSRSGDRRRCCSECTLAGTFMSGYGDLEISIKVTSIFWPA